MLKRAIRNIRHKPKAVRDQYALWTAVIFTAVVITVWFVNLPDRFQSVEQVPDDVAETTNEPGSFTDMIGGLRQDIQNLAQATSTPASTTTQPVATTTRPAATTTWTPVASTSRPVINPTAAAVRIATFTASSAAARP